MENTNEMITNEEVIEVTEEIAKTNSATKVLMMAAGAGIVVLGCVLAYKYVAKPVLAGIKYQCRMKSKHTADVIDDIEDVIYSDDYHEESDDEE